MPPSIALAMGFRERTMREIGYTALGDLSRICPCPACLTYYALLDGVRT